MSRSSSGVEKRLFAEGPKRILALDGGGIRGFLTLQLLRRIETLLRERRGEADATLSDYFDLIGGTSTGSIIAGMLAQGRSVDYIEDVYRRLADPVFSRGRIGGMVLRPKFPIEELRRALDEQFGDMTIGSDEFKTGFAAMAKRLDTGSPWILHNNPRGKYFEAELTSGGIANRDMLVKDIIRASTAAPTYFEPEWIEIARGVKGLFADGGVSPHNNPALQLLMLATLEGYGLRWPMGEDKILLVSVGTGSKPNLVTDDAGPAGMFGMNALLSLMDDTSALNETLLQWMSASPTARSIDGELGDLRSDQIGSAAQLTYLRYDAELNARWLRERAGMSVSEDELEGIEKMDRPQNRDMLIQIGFHAAERLIVPDHFPALFDPNA